MLRAAVPLRSQGNQYTVLSSGHMSALAPDSSAARGSDMPIPWLRLENAWDDANVTLGGVSMARSLPAPAADYV